EVLHPERQAHHARGVPPEVARGLAVLRLRVIGIGARDDDPHLPRAEDERSLTALLEQLRAGLRHELEAELLGVEAPAPLEIDDREVVGVVAHQTEVLARHAFLVITRYSRVRWVVRAA